MEGYWFLKDPGSTHLSDKKRLDRKAIKRKAPLKDWVKLNFDGACKRNRGDFGFGAIIRNERGKLLYGIYGGLGFATNNEAELRALEVGLHLCVQMGISKVIIEGDSQIIINNIIKSNFQNWKLRKWLPRINNLLDTIGNFEINHSFKEGNRMADYLANLGVGKNVEIIIFIQIYASESIIEQILKDIPDSPREGIG
ncbi:uncharacterized protein LOC131860084 [Cryptomeria japonica]|uniref:uncharacterized protein LOC131860084 n=1 Tax=Cryptomeria japonica TaxID=3369 RepID=UPI0027DA40A4|nr:uncharacterized protein LOC131860084 [Cryptomeria japonica]